MLSKLKVKYIQSLGHKKFRDEHGVFIAEGPKTIEELVKEENIHIREIYAVEQWVRSHRDIPGNITVNEVTAEELETITQMSTANQVLAVIDKFPPTDTLHVRDEVVLALDTIQDPGNLGTIIRIADWFGIRCIICNKGSAELYNPKVVQSTMGSIARVEVYYTDLLTWLPRQKDLRIYATALEGQDIGTMKKLQSGIILIGNESKGVGEELLNLANVKVTIPRKGKAESLNAAVATGIILAYLL